jgi:hypothetical protein
VNVPILAVPTVDWYCPACGQTDQTRQAGPHTRYHGCAKLRGMSVPYVQKGTAAKVELREREDYVGSDLVRLDPELGRPVMSIVTTRDEGMDAVVFVPTARGGVA